MTDDPERSSFPRRQTPAVRVDSGTEEIAYLITWPPRGGAWERAGQMLVPGPDGPENHLTLRALDGTNAVVRFAVGSFYGRPESTADTPSERVAAAMQAGLELAKTEGPLHPGSQPQYPVPSELYSGTVAIPLAIIALDQGKRGLYAPPRIAVIRWPSAEPVGVGDAPGFDPDQWPPPRLGDWPPEAIRDWEPTRLAGSIERFTAIWGRLLDTWFGGEPYPQLDDEKREARLLLNWLVPPAMTEVYADLSPKFWDWLAT